MGKLLGNLRLGVDRAAFEARKKARLLSEQSKLKGLRAQEHDQLLELGKTIWDLYVAGETLAPRLQEICQRIQATEQQIAQQETQISAIKQEQPPEPLKCSHCDRELKADDAFCSSCGEVAPTHKAVVPATVALPLLCPQCGRELRSGAKFCGSCGHRLS